MKRFYCTVCKKIKRVQNLPRGVSEAITNPQDRTGQCNRHAKERGK